MNRENSLPSPADLAKKQKDTLKNVSLRIKQNTYDIFDVMAKENNSSASAMMISLLDFYAENYRTKQTTTFGNEDLSIKMMESYLEKTRDNLLKLDDDARILKLTGTDIYEEMLEESEVYSIANIKTTLEKIKNGTADKCTLPLYYIFGNASDYYSFDYMTATDNTNLKFETEDYEKDGEGRESFMNVPADKWAIGINILAAYQKRAKELKPNTEAFFTEKMAKEIYEAGVKSKNIIDYSRQLVDILIMFWKGLNE